MKVMRKLADISTAHLTEHTCNRYLKQNDCKVCAYEFDYGWFVIMPTELEEMKGVIPNDLYQCLLWAKCNEVDIIKFDCDADEVEDLPEYDW